MTVVEDCAGLLNETWRKILEPREVLLRLALVYGAPKLLRVQNVSGRTLQLQDFPNGFSVSFQLEWVDLRVSLKYLYIGTLQLQRLARRASPTVLRIGSRRLNYSPILVVSK